MATRFGVHTAAEKASRMFRRDAYVKPFEMDGIKYCTMSAALMADSFVEHDVREAIADEAQMGADIRNFEALDSLRSTNYDLQNSFEKVLQARLASSPNDARIFVEAGDPIEWLYGADANMAQVYASVQQQLLSGEFQIKDKDGIIDFAALKQKPQQDKLIMEPQQTPAASAMVIPSYTEVPVDDMFENYSPDEMAALAMAEASLLQNGSMFVQDDVEPMVEQTQDESETVLSNRRAKVLFFGAADAFGDSAAVTKGVGSLANSFAYSASLAQGDEVLIPERNNKPLLGVASKLAYQLSQGTLGYRSYPINVPKDVSVQGYVAPQVMKFESDDKRAALRESIDQLVSSLDPSKGDRILLAPDGWDVSPNAEYMKPRWNIMRRNIRAINDMMDIAAKHNVPVYPVGSRQYWDAFEKHGGQSIDACKTLAMPVYERKRAEINAVPTAEKESLKNDGPSM